MNDPALIRGACLLVPVALTAALWAWRAPSERLRAGILLALIWNMTALLAVQVAAVELGWWHYEAHGGVAFGVPVDLLIGWALLWSAAPLLAFDHCALVVSVTAAALLDVALMPRLAPVVTLGDRWLAGEVVALSVCMVPGLLLGHWTATAAHLRVRAVLQVALTGALVLWLVPSAALGTPAGLVAVVRHLPPLATAVVLAVLALVALVGVAAVNEFVERGDGTPLPYDPPPRLVRSGPYAYCRNPMQTSITVIFAIMAAVAGSLHLAGAALVALAYGAGLAVWHEEEELPARFGWPWTQYRVSVPAWRLRARPARSGPQATMWIGRSCAQCVPFERFLRARRPTRLTLRAAEEHPALPRRMTYEVEGMRWDGVAAFARALEHLHIGWAIVGWTLRLPGITPALQVVVDAAGGGPRLVSAAHD